MQKIVSLALITLSINLSAQKIWSLQECVDYALNNNLQVIQNNQSKAIQEKNLSIAKKEYLPSVNGNIGNTASFGQGQDIFGNNQRNDNFNNNANIGANITIYNHGRIEKNIRRVQYDVEAAQYDVQTVQNNIAIQIAQQYLAVLLNKEIVKISESAYANAEQLYNRAKITTDVGTTAKTILYEAQANLAREKQNVKTAEINKDRALFSLSQLLQLPNYKEFDIEYIAADYTPDAPAFSAEQLLNNAYENQPQIKAAGSRIKSAESQTEVNKTNYWPTISANAGLGTFYFNSLVTNYSGINPDGTPAKEPGFFKQYKNNFGQQIGLSANIPIFNKGITKLQVEQSKINEDIAKNNFEQQKMDIKQNIQKAAFDAEANYEAYVAAVSAALSTGQALDFAEKSYTAGRTTIYELNNARNNYANAQGSVAQAKYNYLFSQKLLNFYAGIPLSL